MPTIRCVCGCVILYRPEQSGGIARCPRCSTLLRVPGLRRPRSATSGLTTALVAGPDGAAAEVAVPSYRHLVKEAFSYPFRAPGLAVWTASVLFFTVAHLSTHLLWNYPVVGWMTLVLAYLLLTGYVGGYILRIIWASGAGRRSPPDWPDMVNYEDNVFKPFLYLLVLSALPIGPYLAYHFGWGKEVTWVAELAILTAGMFYMAMGLLCVAVAGTRGLSPVAIFRAISCAPLPYVLPWALTSVAAVLRALGGPLIDKYFPVPIVPTLLEEGIGLYILFVAARLLGLLYYTSRKRLRWLVA